ncbi:zf-HC2 domain-containing protein [Marinobacter sp. AN1]|uniref:zf-HC2 domain-containing protein n=1 Tax=Marinobacter sp. AN1 TaxID=2886046 RepID=UPI00222E2AB8|nr:zf-HC2 domain-containing protein [Marinobacter sp. AN1]UZD65910.1 zf-HC2 domain-containing protein [Marinobacter sp. AN1]
MLMCRDLARIGSDYIDGQLSTADNFSVKMHLLMCRHCRSFIGNLRESAQLMKGHSDYHLDEEYLRRLESSIDEALKG